MRPWSSARSSGRSRSRPAHRGRCPAPRRSAGRSVAQHVEDLRLRPAVDEHHEPEPVALLVVLVQAGELGEYLGIGVGSLFRRRTCREPGPLTDRRMRGEDLDASRRRQLVDERPRAFERVPPRRRAARRTASGPRTARRAARRSAPAVTRAPVGGDQQRDVVVAASSRISSSIRVKKGDGGWKTSWYSFGSRSSATVARPSMSVSVEAISCDRRAARSRRRRRHAPHRVQHVSGE